MASDRYQPLFQCVECESQLNETSKTLPCLHSLCKSCFCNTVKDEDREGKCPQCGDGFQNNKTFTLSPILANDLKLQRLSLLKCDTCLKESNSSIAKYWCINCEKLLCTNCLRLHNTFTTEHISKNLDEMKRMDLGELIMRHKCLLHGKELEYFCNNCNMCYCNTCYKFHSNDPSSNCTKMLPLLVKKETLKMKTQVPNLRKEMNEFNEFLQSSNEKSLKYINELNLECESKCQDVWIKYEQILENAKLHAFDLCEKLRQETAKEVKKCQNVFEKNTRIIKEVEIWLLNLQYLLHDDHKDQEVLCGLKLLTSRLPSRQHKWMELIGKCELCFTLPDWWHQAMQPLVSRQIPSLSCVWKTIPVKKLVKENQWILPGSKSRDIRTILISEKDKHIFLCDNENKSIIEINEIGQFLSEFLLSDKRNQNLDPADMCSISSEEFVVCVDGGNKLIFLKRIKNDPFLQIQKIVATKKYIYSLCLKNETIFTCDVDFGIHLFTKEGIEIKTITNEGIGKSKCCPRIRADSLSGKLWGSSCDRSEMFCFNSEGEKIDSFKKENKFFDFSLTEFGEFYGNCKGIISLFPQKFLYTFEKRSQKFPSLFVFQNKMFICFIKDDKWIIEVLRILY